jgi:PPK2 family polyphosphate:nucleotide phosphotransferase
VPRKIKNSFDFVRPYRVTSDGKFRLKDFDTADTQGLDLKDESNVLLRKSVEKLSDLQQKLYAEDRWSLLLIFQAMDAAGKDGTIRHVMSGINPQGCQVYSFKAPSAEELDHDFLWRTTKALPERGRIGIFNRSYYEEVLVVRVHPEMLKRQQIPPELLKKNVWKNRFEDIRAFEQHLERSGTIVRKFFLNISKGEQKKRFLRRLDEPDKNWKFSDSDVQERAYWDDYMEAYEEAIRHTASAEAPWYVVPSDNKWFARLVVANVVTDTLEGLKLAYPTVDAAKKDDLTTARKHLLGEK